MNNWSIINPVTYRNSVWDDKDIYSTPVMKTLNDKRE